MPTMSKHEEDCMFLWRDSRIPLADMLSIYIKSHNAKAEEYNTDNLSNIYLDVWVWNALKEELASVNSLLFTSQGFIWFLGTKIIPISITEQQRANRPEKSYMFFQNTFGGITGV